MSCRLQRCVLHKKERHTGVAIDKSLLYFVHCWAYGRNLLRSFRGLLCKTSHSSLSSCPHSGESKLTDKRGHSDVTGLKYRKYNIIEYTFKFNEMKYI